MAACLFLLCTNGPAIAAEAQRGPVDALRALAEAGDPEAQFRYGTLRYYGLGVVQDWADAVGWLRRAAAHGQAGASTELGMIYQIGNDGVLQDFTQAATLYKNAAGQGDNEARLALAGLALAGQGVDKDAAAAADWLRQAGMTADQLAAPGGSLSHLYSHFLAVATAIVPLPDDQQIP